MNLDFDLNSKDNKLAKLKKNIISWYPISEGQTVLQIGQEEEIFAELKTKTEKVTVIDEKSLKSTPNQYDFVVLIGTFEKLNTEKEILDLLHFAQNAISDNGKILLAMQNKFGMKYWAGDDDYESIISSKENVLSFPKIKNLLNALNLKFKFYYPLPDYRLTNVIYTDDFMPSNDSIDARILTFCEEGKILSFSEREAYKQLIKEEKSLFTFFSNSYFIEISKEGIFEDIKYASYSITRKQEYSIKTVMKPDYVYKTANDRSANKHIQKIANNIKILKDCHINCLDTSEKDVIISSYLEDAQSLDLVLMQIYEKQGLDAVIDKIKEFYENILKKLLQDKTGGDQTVFEKYEIEIPQNLKQTLHFTPYGVYDLIFQNCLIKGNEIFAYDQEWYEENLPIEFILYRAILYFTELKSKENIGEIFEKLALSEYTDFFEQLENKLQKNILDEEIWNLHVNSVKDLGNLRKYKEENILQKNHIGNLEKNIDLSNNHIKNLETNIENHKKEINKLRDTLEVVSGERKELMKLKEKHENDIENLNNQLAICSGTINNYEKQFNIIRNSKSWKITKPLRYISWVLNFKNKIKLVDRLMPPGSGMRNRYEEKRHQRFLNMAAKKFYKDTDEETAMVWAEIEEKIRDKRMHNLGNTPYELWLKHNEPTPEELEEQRNHHFEIKPKISIVVPLYNTDTTFFRELLYFMNRQTYSNWELCLVDASPKPLEEIQKMCEKDKRIKYKILEKNAGIADNTNEAIKMATGDFIGLLDHDDLLTENCLYEVVNVINKNPDVDFIYTDEDKIEDMSQLPFQPHFKPDFAPDTLRTNNYICHFSVFRKELMEKLGGERNRYDGAQDFDLVLRMSEETQNIVHIPRVLYHWRISSTSTAGNPEAKMYAYESGMRAVEDHIQRLGLKGKVSSGIGPGFYRTQYNVIGNPKVTILIPNKDGIDMLDVCLKSVLEKTTYTNYEIVIIENNSENPETFQYYKEIEKNPKIKILKYPEKGFNYSKIINFGVRNTQGDFVVQLNNDTELLTPDWLEKMIGFAQREDVGAVGVRLYYPDNTIQHAGIMIGVLDLAGHMYRNLSKDICGYFAKDRIVQNMNAVTAACMMTKREIFEQVGFMNEEFAVAFNDVDFCLRIRKLGKLIVYNPDVELIHYESKTRPDDEAPDQTERFHREINLCIETWKDKILKGDEYYNKNFRLDSDQYEFRTDKIDY